jgi:hypothetical protein
MLRLALVAMLIAGVPVMGAGDVSAASGKTKAEKSAKRKAEKKFGRKSEDRIAHRSRTGSSRDKTHTKKKKEKSKTITTRVHEFNGGVYKVARRGRDWVAPYVRSSHYRSSHYKRDYYRHQRKCSVAAKRRRGRGGRIWGIAGHKYGSRACRRAMKECRRELRRHKSRGRNPYAKCVIIHRG